MLLLRSKLCLTECLRFLSISAQLYARWLAAAADVPRLRLLCDRLLGPTAPAASTPKERATKKSLSAAARSTGASSSSSLGLIGDTTTAPAEAPLRPHPPLPWWSAEAGPTCCGGLLSKRGLLASTVHTVLFYTFFLHQ